MNEKENPKNIDKSDGKPNDIINTKGRDLLLKRKNKT